MFQTTVLLNQWTTIESGDIDILTVKSEVEVMAYLSTDSLLEAKMYLDKLVEDKKINSYTNLAKIDIDKINSQFNKGYHITNLYRLSLQNDTFVFLAAESISDIKLHELDPLPDQANELEMWTEKCLIYEVND